MSFVNPILSVVLPVFNAEKYVEEAVSSILCQTFTDFELILINDGSTDKSLEYLQRLKDLDSRIILISRENKGLVASLNEGIDLARGKWLARMDADDISYPDRFLRQIEVLENDSTLDLVATGAIKIDENNETSTVLPCAITHEEVCIRPWRGFYLPHPTWMGRTEWFRKHRYAVPACYLCEDQELLLRTFSDSNFCTIPEVLFAYRVRKKTQFKRQLKTRIAVFKVFYRYFIKTKQPVNVCLTVATLVARSVKDILKLTVDAFN